jgi:protein tyrosine kinase modulator
MDQPKGSNMPQSRVLTPQDYLATLRRRWLFVAVPLVAGLAISYALIRLLPKSYTSQALMLVEQQQIPHKLVEPVITEDLDARIANIEEQTLSRTRLQPIIERYNLFKNSSGDQSMDALVLLLQNAVEITPVKPMVKTKVETIPGFYLSVTLDNPRVAQEVCNDIASMFVDEDIRERQRSAEGTTSFLESQLDDAKRKLDDQDAILADFERKHMGMLPDESKTNLALLGTLNTQLQVTSENLDRAIQNKEYMESLLTQQVAAWKLTRQINGEDGTATSSSSRTAQLAKLQVQLDSLEARYTDQFPDVIKVKAEIADLKKQLAAGSPPDSTGASTSSSSDVLEPPEIQKTRSQVRALAQAVALGTQEQRTLKADIAAYESRLKLSPAVEEEYKKITRDHDTALKFYNDLLEGRNQSEMATDLERRQEGEQLKVMDPASLPDEPSFPKTYEFLGGGVGAGLVLGLALIMGSAQSDRRIRTSRDLQYYLGTTPFALIPSINTIALVAGNGQAGTKKKRLKEKSATIGA